MSKKLAYLFGYFTELFVALILFFSFHRILKHRYRSKLGEVDLIAIKGHTMLFVEVKARFRPSSDLSNLLPMSQRQRIKRTASSFLRDYQIDNVVFVLYHVSFFSVSKYHF